MQSVANVNSLFQNAHAEGSLSAATLATLTIPDIANSINEAMGTPAVDVKNASEVFLVSLLVDDSGSIQMAGNEQTMRDGVNAVIEALKESKARSSILMCIRYLNGNVVVPFTPLDQVIKLDAGNYQANGGTPLYDMTVVSLGDVMAKTQEFSDNGVPVRSASLILTDGHDQHSTRFTRPEDVVPAMKDVLQSETHIVAAMGIQDDQNTDFRDIFTRMGVLPQWILTPGNTQSEIRRALGTFSQSAVRASQAAAHFSQMAMGGFGKP